MPAPGSGAASDGSGGRVWLCQRTCQGRVRAQLHPTIGLDNVRRFDPVEVEGIAKTRPSKAVTGAGPTMATATPPRPPSSPVTGEVAA